jgi:hydroxymethylbilane synthase
LGGCSTPISGLAKIIKDAIIFKGNICSPDGALKIEIEKECSKQDSEMLGIDIAHDLLKDQGAQNLIHTIRNEKK